MNGSIYEPHEIIQMYVDILEDFKRDYPSFVDSKFIYAPVRHIKKEEIGNYLKTLLDIQERFPNFVVGFDLVGQEDKGLSLKELSHELLKFPSTINFFFHAGETKWNGLETDENLVIKDSNILTH